MNKIFISIASYRDPDLINTVLDCYKNASNRSNLFFSILSQAEDYEHPDLFLIPDNQLRYNKVHWSESMGACWARSITSENIIGDYFLQIDSHSRFKKNWDSLILDDYKKCQSHWGKDIVLSNYPDSFTIDWENNKDELKPFDNFYKLRAEWDDAAKMVVPRWEECQELEFGHEVFFVSANNLFCSTEIMKQVPYDKELYFTGEEPSLALRFYTRGFKIINPTIRYMYTNYDRDNGKRNFHWVDHVDWHLLNKKSYQRLSKIMTGDTSLGVFGIGSYELFKEYQEKTGIFLEDKKEIIESV